MSHDYQEQIRRSLVRNVLTDPLLDKVLNEPDQVYGIIIDVNLEYFEGREAAFLEVGRLAELALNVGETASTDVQLPRSLGSQNNPYLVARMPGHMIRRMIELDIAEAQAKHLAAEASDQGIDVSEGPPPKGTAPSQHRRYLAIYRIWEDFPIRPLIDKSISTVKADAARRAFLAEGLGIVWAVIDSGIDKNHIHFQDFQTLEMAAPVQHADFTIPDGVGSATALTDEFGHGTHVAGILAGGFVSPRQEADAALGIRTRLDPSGNELEEHETIKAITGMAPACKLVSLKVLDPNGYGSVSNIIAAIDFIQRVNDFGRRLLIHGVNLSVGYEFEPKWFACGQSPVCVEVNRLVRSGVIVVVAAGNTGYGTLAANVRATGAGMMLTINDPGNADLAITVGSTHRDMPHTYGVSYFSSKGPTGDGRCKPDMVAPGERILSCRSSTRSGGSVNHYFEDSGTSMAAPHVSGVMAAFLSIRREYVGQPETVKRLFLQSATDLGRDRFFQGHGLVDLMRAIQSI
jgi:hypothetical protein